MKMQLAAEQREVVFAGAEDVFVAAAAGSGKTRVLVGRFVAAILGETDLGSCSTTDILAMTFTDKAAGEIAERVRSALLAEGHGADARRIEQAWVSTIHGMCSRVLRRYAFEAGLDPRFTVATQVEASILEQEAFEAATRRLMESNSEVERLVIDLGASRVASMVFAGHGALRSMGMAASDVRKAPEPDHAAIISWSTVFGDIATSYAGLGTTKTVEDGMASAVACADVLAGLLGAPDRSGAARVALEVLNSATFRAMGSQDVKDLAASAKELVLAATGDLAQIIASPYEEALLQVIEAFDRHYEATKAQRGVLDFEDLQLKTADLFESNPEIAARYRQAFKLVMIDEFQDTNALQLRIARAVSENDLLTVGDDKQSIYRFRHADVNVFRSLAAKVPAVHVLRANYRSHAMLVGAIDEMFGSEVFFGDDFVRLSAKRDETDPYAWPAGEPRVEFLLTTAKGTLADEKRALEATAIARRLSELRRAGVRQQDMVVLLRAMKGRAEGVEAALRREGFDVYVASGGTYFDRPEVEEMTALLSIIDNPRNDQALMTVLAGRMVALEERTLYRLATTATSDHRLWDAILEADERALPAHERAAIARVVDTIAHLRADRGHCGIAELIHDACEALDYDLVLFASGPDGPRAWANVLKLARLAGEYEQRSAGDLSGFLEHVTLHRQLAPEAQATLTGEGLDAVRIMSIHAAKGLEFPVVVVADLASGGNTGCGEVLVGREERPLIAMKLPKSLFPGGESAESTSFRTLREAEAAADAEEADRLLYVACTRARDGLIMSASVDPSKPAEGKSDIDRLRRAARIGGPASEIQPEVELGGKVHIAVRVETVSLPEKPGRGAPEVRSVTPPELTRRSPQRPEPFVPRDVSYTGLSVYGQCPYKFYATRIARLKTPRVHGDARPLDFGSAVHAALQGTTVVGPTRERLLAIARAHGLGHEQVDHLDHAVQAYLGSETARAVEGADRTRRECPFAMPLGDTLLRGSLDLVAWRGEEATVVDYKTGARELTADAARDRYRSQAECYALAVLRAGAERVVVRFVEIERECRETRFDFAYADIAPIEQRLEAIVSAIGAGAFDPLDAFTPGVCEDCPALGGTCPVNPKQDVVAGAGRTRR